jgi:hypothetical protein
VGQQPLHLGLQPAANNRRRVDLAGTALLVVLYAAMVLAFWRLF